MRQLNLYDARRAAEARDAAIVDVAGGMAPEWEAKALAVVDQLCAMQPTLTTDDVWKVLDGSGVESPTEPRAMGAIMRAAAAMAWCEPTDTTVQSVRVRCHRRPLRLWKSLRYR